MKVLFGYLVAVLLVVACASGQKMKDAESSAEGTKAEMSAKGEDAKKEMEGKANDAKAGAENVAASGDGVKCTYGTEERVISVNNPEGGGCEVNYVRNGEARVIGTAKNDLDHCQTIVNRVVSNLKNNGFTCSE